MVIVGDARDPFAALDTRFLVALGQQVGGALESADLYRRLEARTAELAAQIAGGPPLAISYMKQNINRAMQADFKTCLDWEADRLVRVAQTEDHKEAVRAFIEKRAPEFRGK